jgi:hypothetical protein
MKKYKFNNVQEHWAWAYDNYLRFLTNDDDPWKGYTEELTPFFNYKDGVMSPEVKKSYELYRKVCMDGSDKCENKKIITRLEPAQAVDVMGFIYDYSLEKDDKYAPIIVDTPYQQREDISYPCIMCSWMEMDYDRFSGDNIIVCNSFVSLTEFDPIGNGTTK